MWATFFQKTETAKEDIQITVNSMSTNKMVGIKNLTTKANLNVDSDGLSKGIENTMLIAKD